LTSNDGAGRVHHHPHGHGGHQPLHLQAVGGRAQHQQADMVAAGVGHERLRHVARFDDVERHLVAFQVDALGPLAQPLQVVAVGFGFVLARWSHGRDHGHAGQPRTGADAQRAVDRLAQRIQRGVGGVLVGHGHHHDGHFADLLRDGSGLGWYCMPAALNQRLKWVPAACRACAAALAHLTWSGWVRSNARCAADG
jgi:hypothetical protein